MIIIFYYAFSCKDKDRRSHCGHKSHDIYVLTYFPSHPTSNPSTKIIAANTRLLLHHIVKYSFSLEILGWKGDVSGVSLAGHVFLSQT